MQEQNNGFYYNYSVEDQETIKKIRDKYIEKEESKLDRLRRLDEGATQKAQVVALVLGILGALILGFGMSLFMSELGAIFGENRSLALPIGIVIGVLGGVLVALAYPAYNFVLKKEREKIAPEVLRLTDELLK